MKKIFAVLITICMALSMMSVTVCNAQADIKVGDYIQLGQYKGQRLIWRYAGDDDNGKLMFARDNICIKAFDAAGKETDIKDRKLYGSNLWSESTIRLWLNSNEETVNYIYGNIPDEKGVRLGQNPYHTEAGFLTNFAPEELNVIKEVTLKTPLEEVDEHLADGEYTVVEFGSGETNFIKTYNRRSFQNTTDKIFLLDNEQLDTVMTQLNDDYYKHSMNTIYEGDFSGQDEVPLRQYYLRTPQNYMESDAWLNAVGVYTNGETYYSPLAGGAYGACIRPAFYLADDVAFINGDGTEENPYIVCETDVEPLPYIDTKLGVVSFKGDIQIYIDDDVVEFENNKPFIDDAWRTQVPVRAISEALSFDVTYDEVGREIIIKKAEKEIKLTIGSSQMIVDGNIIEMDTTAIIHNDSTYIPVRFVAEALGCEVSYDRAVTGYMMTEDGVLVPTYD